MFTLRLGGTRGGTPETRARYRDRYNERRLAAPSKLACVEFGEEFGPARSAAVFAALQGPAVPAVASGGVAGEAAAEVSASSSEGGGLGVAAAEA